MKKEQVCDVNYPGLLKCEKNIKSGECLQKR